MPGYTNLYSLCTFERPCSAVYLKRAFELDTFDRTKALDPVAHHVEMWIVIEDGTTTRYSA